MSHSSPLVCAATCQVQLQTVLSTDVFLDSLRPDISSNVYALLMTYVYEMLDEAVYKQIPSTINLFNAKLNLYPLLDF